MRRAATSERGQATVELVLTLPVVVMLVLAVVQVGVVTRDRVVLAHVAREAARQVAVDARQAVATDAARRASGLDPERLQVSLLPPGAPAPQPGDRVTVVIGYRAPTDVPIIGRLVADVMLETEVTVRIE